MSFIFFLIAGLLGGILGGMGMGGGTILIPIISIFLNVKQHLAQSANLISFIPMSFAALIMHTKKGYVKYKKTLVLIFPALIFCVLGSVLAKKLSDEHLKKFFGLFLIILSVYVFVKNCKSKQ